mmetsp:Transcript_34217/g.94231  ORF Transcript_34217/g.94231 Transcript_34217/m.94231 type:complete len:265 (-) Transcript_34217:127-921(-)
MLLPHRLTRQYRQLPLPQEAPEPQAPFVGPCARMRRSVPAASAGRTTPFPSSLLVHSQLDAVRFRGRLASLGLGRRPLRRHRLASGDVDFSRHPQLLLRRRVRKVRAASAAVIVVVVVARGRLVGAPSLEIGHAAAQAGTEVGQCARLVLLRLLLAAREFRSEVDLGGRRAAASLGLLERLGVGRVGDHVGERLARTDRLCQRLAAALPAAIRARRLAPRRPLVVARLTSRQPPLVLALLAVVARHAALGGLDVNGGRHPEHQL